jgi:sulfite reductase (NADPH) flavoprotein alpha-component
MNSIRIPDSAPFSAPQRMWLKGFLAGLSAHQPPASPPAAAPPSGQPVHILWGSQTGNSEALAKRLAKQLSAAGHQPSVQDMAAVSTDHLANMARLLIITSTYGDGEPPDNAAALHEALAHDGLGLSSVSFAVLALGDSNYAEFCKCGHDFHHRLLANGAQPLRAVTTCDVEYDETFAAWSAGILSHFSHTPVPA